MGRDASRRAWPALLTATFLGTSCATSVQVHTAPDATSDVSQATAANHLITDSSTTDSLDDAASAAPLPPSRDSGQTLASLDGRFGSNTLFRCGSMPALALGAPAFGCGSPVIAGSTSAGYADRCGGSARFGAIVSLAVDPDGTLYVGDENPTAGRLIRKVTPDGCVSTLAGGADLAEIDGNGGTNGTARFIRVRLIALDGHGNLLVWDANSVRRVSLADGSVTTVAHLRSGGVVDGDLATAQVTPTTHAIAVDPRDGTIVFSDVPIEEANVVRRLDLAAGTITTLSPNAPGSAFSMVVGSSGTIYFTAVWAVWSVPPTGGDAVLIAGDPGTPGFIDGQGTMARFGGDEPLTMASDGSLLLADANRSIRRVSPTFDVTTVARTDGMAGMFIGVDASGEIYLASPTWIERVR